MFLQACCYGEDVRVKDDVVGVEAKFVHQQFVGSLTDGYLLVYSGGLHKI